MTAPREQIMEALFALVSGAAGFVTASRRLRLWDDVPVSQRPAIFQYERSETFRGGERHLPPILVLNVQLLIHCSSPKGQSFVPASTLNPLLDAVCAALSPGAGGQQTLGGLVSHCYIDGEIQKEPGDLDNDGVAVITIKIVTNR